MIERRQLLRSSDLSDSLFFCCGDLSERWDFAGNDSLVYLFGEHVVKVYNQGKWRSFSESQASKIINLYKEITNSASRFSEEENWHLNLRFNNLALPLRVAPIEKVIRCSCCGSFASVSPFVEGKNLEEKMINSRFDLRELRVVLPQLSLDFCRRFSVSGISILPINIKYFQEKLIITDLCSNLSILKALS
ncbi:MAG: hypothetical protein KatS3mg088_010 [Patescibacteria group bacterium]|nr:MAG: hypothetical protein KatS3mg088_010 [Patescibacteria group bacterium]